MEPPSTRPQASTLQRRRFLEMAGGALGLSVAAGCSSAAAGLAPSAAPRSGPSPASFDPWIEIDRTAFVNNVREASRLAGGRPILAVVKNNAYGLGDQVVGPLLADLPEVGGLACVRVEEAVLMREAGVTKPIVVMAVTSDDEMEEMVRHDVVPSVWLDDAPVRLERLSARLRRRIPVQLFVDTGMGREGMPFQRARPWIEELCRSASVQVEGTYTMFSHDLDFDREQLSRFLDILEWARGRRLALGRTPRGSDRRIS